MSTNGFIACMPKRLPDHKLIEAAATAISINPANAPPPISRLASIGVNVDPSPRARAVMSTQFWGSAGAHLTVQFLDNPSRSLKANILFQANRWSKMANVSFVESNTDAICRLARTPGDGHYSYVGTGNLHVPKDEKTMNFDGFSDETELSELIRVVPHEFGHLLGLLHELQRKEETARLDHFKTYLYYKRTQGWSESEIDAQVLTPIEDSDILLETKPDERSIMAYSAPGSITIDGKPIIGGTDLNANDYELMGLIYPLPSALSQARSLA